MYIRSWFERDTGTTVVTFYFEASGSSSEVCLPTVVYMHWAPKQCDIWLPLCLVCA